MPQHYTIRRRHGIKPTPIDLAPLVDVALILVVFLLLSGQGQVARLVEVSLPHSDNGTVDQPTLPSLSIAADGSLSTSFQNLGPCKETDIEQHFAHLGSVVLLVDTSATHGRVVEIEDFLRAAGVQEIFYATESHLDEW